MQTRDLVLVNPNGLHMRVAAKIVQVVQRYGAKVRLYNSEHRQADGESVLDLMTLGIESGASVHLEVEGANEFQATRSLEELFADGSGI